MAFFTYSAKTGGGWVRVGGVGVYYSFAQRSWHSWEWRPSPALVKGRGQGRLSTGAGKLRDKTWISDALTAPERKSPKTTDTLTFKETGAKTASHVSDLCHKAEGHHRSTWNLLWRRISFFLSLLVAAEVFTDTSLCGISNIGLLSNSLKVNYIQCLHKSLHSISASICITLPIFH